MDKNVFTFSEDGNKEYSASIVKIGELIPIEGSDFLAKTVVDGEDIVIRKDGDPVCETYKLKCSSFLLMESKAIDKGEVDIEMYEGYGCN